MALTKQVRGVRADKEAKIARRAVRAQDLPPCADCLRPSDPMVQGYDDKWRCMRCQQMHIVAVEHESGESAPLPSDETVGRPAVHDEVAETKRQARAKAMIEKYGAKRKNAVWI